MFFVVFDEVTLLELSTLVLAKNFDELSCLLLNHTSELLEVFKSMNFLPEEIHLGESCTLINKNKKIVGPS